MAPYVGCLHTSDQCYIPVYTLQYLIIYLKIIFYCPFLPPHGRKSDYGPGLWYAKYRITSNHFNFSNSLSGSNSKIDTYYKLQILY